MRASKRKDGFDPRIKLIVGLGNPSRQYRNTYHNAGSLAVDFLRNAAGAPDAKIHGSKLFEYARAQNLIFAKPLVFMNESGAALRAMSKFFRVKPAEILVLHDDSDLPIGVVKRIFNRGSAGHRGVDSVTRALGTKEFFRVRIGTRNLARYPLQGRRIPASAFALRPMREDDRAALVEAFEKAANELNLVPVSR
ncbi:peptidyl-tRNA hydrolase [Candidatus Parcubacteria bacterium]|nr:MAG: peptidyl-tRNA hydrolase [Candidatus Parcubacteria bacterium]